MTTPEKTSVLRKAKFRAFKEWAQDHPAGWNMNQVIEDEGPVHQDLETQNAWIGFSAAWDLQLSKAQSTVADLRDEIVRLTDRIQRQQGELSEAKAALAAAESTAAEKEAELDNEEDDIDVGAEWRRLALQFDGHRVQALWHLRKVLHVGEVHREDIEAFLNEAPLSGEDVLKERIAAIGAASQDVLDEADRRAGAAERENAELRQQLKTRNTWIENAKEERGYSRWTSFGRVWNDLCAMADGRAQDVRDAFHQCAFIAKDWGCPDAVGAAMLEHMEKVKPAPEKVAAGDFRSLIAKNLENGDLRTYPTVNGEDVVRLRDIQEITDSKKTEEPVQ
ncbi:hypothetical protein [Salipiger sp. PrR003]|uniref:hypothetical protein n=1 Tax=Salipiger sp. PrR003 TaxID=2706776 RepID=UPI0013DA1588|nr:hypothetical protein [Salipiger sp. PrR003]NDV50390.1 hypothetical protein [Salipiger sp. PrR003]